jgi:NitT/TauT family transport system substrate-binding protein
MSVSVRAAAVTAAVALIVPLLAACAPSNSAGPGSGELVPIEIHVLPSVATVPVYVGVEEGIFKKHGFDLTISKGQGGAAILAAVVAGQAQFGFGNVVSLMQAQEEGLDIVMVANGSLEGDPKNIPAQPQNVVLVPSDSPIKTAADLKGKRVSINSLGNASEVTTRVAIDQAGGDSSTIEFVQMPIPDSLPALEQGQVDAIFVIEPFTSTAIKSGARVVVAPFTDSMPDASASIANYFASAELIERSPKLVADFTAALNEANLWAQTHPDEMRDAVTRIMGIDADVVAGMTFPYWTDKFNVKSIEALGDLSVEYGFLKGRPDYTRLLPACAQPAGSCIL